jgi:hypothetical protein
MKTRMNENTKVTLTLGQIRKLVKESVDEIKDQDSIHHKRSLNEEERIWNDRYAGGVTKIMRKVPEIEKNVNDYVNHLTKGKYKTFYELPKIIRDNIDYERSFM